MRALIPLTMPSHHSPLYTKCGPVDLPLSHKLVLPLSHKICGIGLNLNKQGRKWGQVIRSHGLQVSLAPNFGWALPLRLWARVATTRAPHQPTGLLTLMKSEGRTLPMGILARHFLVSFLNLLRAANTTAAGTEVGVALSDELREGLLEGGKKCPFTLCEELRGCSSLAVFKQRPIACKPYHPLRRTMVACLLHEVMRCLMPSLRGFHV